MKLGVIAEGKLKDHKIILDPRTNLKQNEWYVEKGKFGDSKQFAKACLVCEKFIPDQGCSIDHGK